MLVEMIPVDWVNQTPRLDSGDCQRRAQAEEQRCEAQVGEQPPGQGYPLQDPDHVPDITT